MAKYCLLLPVFLITFLAATRTLTSAKDIPKVISLVKEPEDNYYIFKKSPVVIVCQAKNAAEITFTCMGSQIPASSVEVTDVSDIDPDLIQADIDVTVEDLQNLAANSAFWCECNAIDVAGQVAATSKRGYVTLSFLKNKFGIQPISTTATEGEDVEFACGAPEGQPKPEIVWRKDKKRLEIEKTPRYSITDKGSLLIQYVSLEDKGMYQCVVRNLAGRRESETAELTVAAKEEPYLELSEEDDSDGNTLGLAKPRTTRQSVDSGSDNVTQAHFTYGLQKEYFVSQNNPATLECGVAGASALTFQCSMGRVDKSRIKTKQGQSEQNIMLIQSSVQITYAEVQSYLSQRGDTNMVKCRCNAWTQIKKNNTNRWEQMDTEEAIIHLAYLDEVFQKDPSDVVATVHSDATIICEAPKGSPSPQISWYKERNLLDIRGSEKYSVNAKGHLTIHDVGKEDAGSYSCRAENSVKSAQSKYGRLTVTDKAIEMTTAAPAEDVLPPFPDVIPSTPKFIKDLEAINVIEENGAKKLSCAAVTTVRVTVECNRQRLEDKDVEVKSIEDPVSRRRIFSTSFVVTAEMIRRNSADFFCQCKAWLYENGWKDTLSTEAHFRLSTDQNAFIEDTFGIPQVNVEAELEADATLACVPPEGNPIPTVYWLKDRVRIVPEADPNFVLQGADLYIKSVRETDEGQYTCVAENDAGKQESQPIQFTVTVKPVAEPDVTAQPEVTMHGTTEEEEEEEEEEGEEEESQSGKIHVFFEEENYIIGDDQISLTCQVAGAKYLFFVCNGQPLEATARQGTHYTDPRTNVIVRENTLDVTREMVESYTGQQPYTCHCRAAFSKDNTQQGLQAVDSSPAKIYIANVDSKFLLEPSDTKAVLNEQVEIHCQPPKGIPANKVTWLKNNDPVDISDRIRVDERVTLIIKEYKEEDEGHYACEVYYEQIKASATSKSALVSHRVTEDEHGQVTDSFITPDLETDEPEEETTPKPEIIYSGKPYFSKELYSMYFIGKSKSTTIVCEAYKVDNISVTCGGSLVRNVETLIKVDDNSEKSSSMVKVVEAKFTVTEEDVNNYGAGLYECQCHGHYKVPGDREDHTLSSIRGSVEVADIYASIEEPRTVVAVEGRPLTINCMSPSGNPEPKVTLTKEGNIIEAQSLQRGIFVIEQVQQSHEGVYVCISENHAGTHEGAPITVQVKDTEESNDGKAENDVETNIGESDEETEDITQSNMNGRTSQSKNKISQEILKENENEEDRDNKLEATTWHISEGETKQRAYTDKNEDFTNIITDESEDETTDTYYGGVRVDSNNNNDNFDSEENKYKHEDEDNNHIDIHNTNEINENVDYEREQKLNPRNKGRYDYNEDKEKIMVKKEDGKIEGTGKKQMSNVGNECANMLTECHTLLPSLMDPSFCEAVPDYSACLDRYFKVCNGKVSSESVEAVKTAFMDTKRKCPSFQKCRQLEECERAFNTLDSHNSLDNEKESSGVSVSDFCSNHNEVLTCVDQNLADCDISLSPPEDEIPTFLEVKYWFTQYCDKIEIDDDSTSECDGLEQCVLSFTNVAADNVTYWCRLFDSVMNCTVGACKGKGQLNVLMDLQTEIGFKYCSKVSEEEDEENDSEGAAKPEPSGEKETMDPTDGDNGEDDDKENREGGAEASKEDPNGASMLGTSILLIATLQLLMNCLSWR